MARPPSVHPNTLDDHDSSFPPSRAVAAPVDADQARRPGAAPLGGAPGARTRQSVARAARRAQRRIARDPRALLQGVRDLPAVRAALHLRLGGRPRGREPRGRAELARVPAPGRAARPHHVRGRRRARVRRRRGRPVLLLGCRRRDSRRRALGERHSARARAGHGVSLRPRVPGLVDALGRGRQLPATHRMARCGRRRARRVGLRAEAELSEPRRQVPHALSRVALAIPRQAARSRVPGPIGRVALSADRALPHADDGLSRARGSHGAVALGLRAARPADASRAARLAAVLGALARGFRGGVLRRSVLGSRRASTSPATRA